MTIPITSRRSTGGAMEKRVRAGRHKFHRTNCRIRLARNLACWQKIVIPPGAGAMTAVQV